MNKIITLLLISIIIITFCNIKEGYVFISVTDKNGMPLKDTIIKLMDNNNNNNIIAEMKTKTSGSAHFENIINNDYTLIVIPKENKYSKKEMKITKKDLKDNNPLSLEIELELAQ